MIIFNWFFEEPYLELNNREVINKLEKKENMSKYLIIEDSPKEIQTIIDECLQYDSNIRPNFTSIGNRLKEIYQTLEKHPEENKWKNLSATQTYDQTFIKNSYY